MGAKEDITKIFPMPNEAEILCNQFAKFASKLEDITNFLAIDDKRILTFVQWWMVDEDVEL
jgi:hypothetical protein